MSFGKMKKTIVIKRVIKSKDSEGFPTESLEVIITQKAYREGRHGSERWANLSTFSDCTDLFRCRKIPGIKITTDDIIYCEGERFDIFSVEDVRGRGMYVEILAKKVVSSIG